VQGLIVEDGPLKKRVFLEGGQESRLTRLVKWEEWGHSISGALISAWGRETGTVTLSRFEARKYWGGKILKYFAGEGKRGSIVDESTQGRGGCEFIDGWEGGEMDLEGGGEKCQ